MTNSTSPISWTEIPEDEFEEALNVLPPVVLLGKGFLLGEPQDHEHSANYPRYTAYLQRNGKFLKSSRPLTIREFKEV